MSSKGTKVCVSCKKTQTAPQAVMHLLQALKVLQLCPTLKDKTANFWVDNYQNQKSCFQASLKRPTCDNAAAVRSCSENSCIISAGFRKVSQENKEVAVFPIVPSHVNSVRVPCFAPSVTASTLSFRFDLHIVLCCCYNFG